MDSRSPNTPRKKPQQERSRATVDAILEASMQLLVEEGYDKLTTTRVAERAGVSVGTLYQYFPSKDAIIHALIERNFARNSVILTEALAASENLPLAERIRVILRGLLRAKAAEPELMALLADHMARIEGGNYKALAVRAAADLIRPMLIAHADEIDLLGDLDRTAWVIAHLVEGLIQGTVREGGDLGRPELLADLSAVVCRVLRIDL